MDGRSRELCCSDVRASVLVLTLPKTASQFLWAEAVPRLEPLRASTWMWNVFGSAITDGDQTQIVRRATLSSVLVFRTTEMDVKVVEKELVRRAGRPAWFSAAHLFKRYIT